MPCATRCQPLLPILTTLMWNTPLPFMYKALGIPGFDFNFEDLGGTSNLEPEALLQLRMLGNFGRNSGFGGLRGPGNFLGSTLNRLGKSPLSPIRQDGTPTGGGGQPGDPTSSGAGCICSSPSGALKIVCCQAGGSCKFDCSVLSNPQGTMVLGVCGGSGPPYTWSTTKGTIASSGTYQATLTKPVNTGSGVAGTAYAGHCANSPTNWWRRKDYGCDDSLLSTTETSGCNSPTCGSDGACFCRNADSNCATQTCCQCIGGELLPNCVGGGVLCNQGPDRICDTRTQQMKDAGCAPCLAAMSGAVVTVTDSAGNTAAKTITT